ncbi:DUF6197 family protein [Actinacidiphila acididurans]|uniref:Uncharacterized protein n=1 Tax=Actinacidiphila acididurans TaxID=2784346 RepID=A0ABS2U729_9ACTN|nr:hypothetical protein [Actinacidiphila acididurans]MBM9509963.1 hypothetical protein [Actinacidiphila acididurans]
MPGASPDPDLLDQQAAALIESAAWQAVLDGWHTTAPEPTTPPAPDQTAPASGGPYDRPGRGSGADLVGQVPGLLLTKTTAQLVREAGIVTGPAPADRQLPGRLAAVLPDRLHTWRRLYQPDIKPSVQLGWAATVLTEWGWQARPYRLRDARGARCVCGAILAAERLGHGSRATTDHSAAWVMVELKGRGWPGLIGEWNRQPGRTADQAIALVTAAAHRATQAGY